MWDTWISTESGIIVLVIESKLKESEATQDLASITETVYNPAAKFIAQAVNCALLFHE